MKKLIRKWLGITQYELINTGLSTTLATQGKLHAEEIKKLKDSIFELEQNQKYWRQLWARFNALEDYLNVRARKEEIPDMSYIPKEQPMIEVYRYESAPKKKPKKS